jgi:hypothetical protein
MDDAKFWVVTASADHAAIGRREGIVQAGHGKAAPLLRLSPGDGVVIYSPRETFPDGTALQAFTAIGRVAAGEPWIGTMGGGFRPWRRGVTWVDATPAPIRPMLQDLHLTRGMASWGMAFRYGLRPVSAADFALIATAMGASRV